MKWGVGLLSNPREMEDISNLLSTGVGRCVKLLGVAAQG